MNLGGFEGSTESSYLAGPRIFVLSSSKLQLFGKGLVGVGRIHYPFQIGNANYLAIVPEGGVEYRLADHWMLRAEYEYQFWLNSPGYANLPDHPFAPDAFAPGSRTGYSGSRLPSPQIRSFSLLRAPPSDRGYSQSNFFPHERIAIDRCWQISSFPVI